MERVALVARLTRVYNRCIRDEENAPTDAAAWRAAARSGLALRRLEAAKAGLPLPEPRRTPRQRAADALAVLAQIGRVIARSMQAKAALAKAHAVNAARRAARVVVGSLGGCPLFAADTDTLVRVAAWEARRATVEAAKLAARPAPLRIGLVSCSKTKLGHEAPARDLYVSPLFRKSLAYAEKHCDVVYVVSALHGLLALDREVAPYDHTLAGARKRDRQAWGWRVASALLDKHGRVEHEVVMLAGEDYAQGIKSGLVGAPVTVVEPLKHKQLGERLAFLKAS